MSITYKATTTGALENPSTSLTFSGPNVTVDNTIVIVGAQIRGSESNTAITGVTYNGSAMTKIGETTTGVEVSLWYIITELTGSKNIVVSVDGNSRILAFASYYEGVNQTSPIDTFSTESSSTNTTSYSVSISPTQNDCMLVDVCGYNDQNGSTAGSGQTEICDFLGMSDSYRMLGSYKSVESSGSNSMSWTTPYTDTNAVVASLAPVSSIEDSAERSLYLEGRSTIQIPDTYTDYNAGIALQSVSGQLFAGQSLSLGSKGVLNSVSFLIRKQGSPTGKIVAKAYTSTGTIGSTAKPDGSALATSLEKDISSISSSLEVVRFYFQGDERITIGGGGYSFTLELVDDDTDADNYVVFAIDSTSPTHAGNLCYKNYSGTIYGTSLYDSYFVLYMEYEYTERSIYLTGTDKGFHILTDGLENTGWTSTLVSGSNGLWSFVDTGTNPTCSPFQGSYMARFNSFSYNSTTARLSRDANITLEEGLDASLKFHMYHDSGYSGSNDEVQPQISVDNGENWTNLGSVISRYSLNVGWQEHSLDISSYMGDSVKIGFLGISKYGMNCFIDNVRIVTRFNYYETSSEFNLYLEGSGGGQANAERNIYLGGIDNSFGERGLFLIGKDTNTSDLNLYLEGSLANIYTRESESDLEEDDSLLETFFTEQDYTDVATEDDTFVNLVGASTYFKYLFKEYNENNSSEPFVITWKGKSTLAPSSSAIYLQIYNRASEEWESLDSDNSSNANAKITLSGSKNSDLENYYNEDYIISCRVYQEV